MQSYKKCKSNLLPYYIHTHRQTHTQTGRHTQTHTHRFPLIPLFIPPSFPPLRVLWAAPRPRPLGLFLREMAQSPYLAEALSAELTARLWWGPELMRTFLRDISSQEAGFTGADGYFSPAPHPTPLHPVHSTPLHPCPLLFSAVLFSSLLSPPLLSSPPSSHSSHLSISQFQGYFSRLLWFFQHFRVDILFRLIFCRFHLTFTIVDCVVDCCSSCW